MAKKVGKQYLPDEEVAENIKEMKKLLDMLRAEYNQFFNGHQKHLPFFREEQIRRILKQFQGGEVIRRPSDRYQYFNFMAKFNANMELWKRKVKQLEGQHVFGRQASPFQELEHGGPHVDTSQHKSPSAHKYSAITSDPMNEKATMQRFLDEFQKANKMVGKDRSSLTVDGFSKFLNKQVEAVKKKNNSNAVRVTVKVVDGDVKLSVKSIK